VVEGDCILAQELANALVAFGNQAVGPVAQLSEAMTIIERGPIDGAVLDANLDVQTLLPLACTLTQRAIPYVLAAGGDLEVFPDALQGVPGVRKPVNMWVLRWIMRKHNW
jgi:hypothetical protein